MAGEMIWSTQSGYLTNGKLSKTLLEAAQPLTRFRQFCSLKEAFGKGNGEVVNFTKIADVGTYGGKLIETNTYNQTTQALSQGTLTVYEYGVALPYTFKLSALSEFDIKRIIKTGLAGDMAKVLDGEVERQFNATLLRYVGTTTTGGGLTTNGTATLTNTSVLNTYHLGVMKDYLLKRNVQGFSKAGGDYVMIVSIEAARNIKNAMLAVNQYTQAGYQRIADGEIGRFDGIRFVLDQFATRYTYDSTARTATAKTWSGGFSLEGYMFGEDTVMKAVAVPEEMRMKEISDYGRSHGMAWYFLGGWKIVRDATGAGDSTIIKWDSAA